MYGTIEIAHQEVRKALRRKMDKNEEVNVGIIDSCSVRMNATSGLDRCIDGNKKIKGLKRHMLVDSLGLIIDVVIHAPNIHDSKGVVIVFEKLEERKYAHPRLRSYLQMQATEGI